MTAQPPPRSFFERVRRLLEATELVTVLVALFDVGRAPGDPAPPRAKIEELAPALSPAQIDDIEWIYGLVRGSEILEGLGMLRGLMGGGNTRLPNREAVDVVPFVEHHIVDLLTFQAALMSIAGREEGETLRVKLISEIQKAVEARSATAFSDDFDMEVAHVISLDLCREAKEERQREQKLVAEKARAANPEPVRPGYHRVMVYRPHPYVFRINNILDVLGAPFEGRDPALENAQRAYEDAREQLGLVA